MARLAAARGVVLLGRDLLEPGSCEANERHFDVITAIAVFEHLRDIRQGFAAALRMLREDGILLFEVPLLAGDAENSVWLRSSLEHVWYPTERGLRWLVEDELGADLLGS